MEGHFLKWNDVPARLLRAGLLLMGLAASSCATPTGRFVECPLSATEQQQAIREIVPLGTSRVQVAERLAKAGIEFTKAAGDSIYYCAAWQRPEGTQWHMNVALLFDREDKLYQVREANTLTLRDTDPPETTNRNSPARAATSQNGQEAATSSNFTVPDSDRIPFSR